MNNIRLFPRYVNSFQVKDVEPIKEVQYNPLSSLQKYLTRSDIMVLNEIIGLGRRFPDIYIKHETIASTIGRCRKTVLRSVSKLKELGLLNYLFRHNKSSLYRPSSFLLRDWVRSSLKQILPALSWISSKFLLMGTFAYQSLQTEMSHDINKNRFIYLSTVSIKHRLVNYDNNKGAKKVKIGEVMNPRIEKLRELLNLEFHEANGLSKYPDWILDKALKRIDGIQSVQYKSQYLFALCEKELNPPPRIERAYNHLKKKYSNTSNNSYDDNQPKPPAYKEYKSNPVVLEKMSEDKLDFLNRKIDLESQNSKNGLDYKSIALCIQNLFNATRENNE